jgi:serine/threonine protein kinase
LYAYHYTNYIHLKHFARKPNRIGSNLVTIPNFDNFRSAFGTVFKAKSRAGEFPLAIKVVKVDMGIDEIKQEIDVLKKCNSEYIVNYFGSIPKQNYLWVSVTS